MYPPTLRKTFRRWQILHPLILGVLALGVLFTLFLGSSYASAASTAPSGASSGNAPPRENVLILYDDSAAQAASDQAAIYVIMLENLLGHFGGLTIEKRPTTRYEPGSAFNTLRTFYIGSVYDAEVPETLLEDALQNAPITWLAYNVWQLSAPDQNALGFTYLTLHHALAPASFTRTFNRIRYRDFIFNKYPAPMEMIELRAEGGARVHAWALDADDRRVPYILQHENFWYVADNPFTYLHETDRYLVFADTLGLMLGRQETCEPEAILRFEDVSPVSDPAALETAFTLARALELPAAAAVVPRYLDAAGGVVTERTWADAPDVVGLLQEFEAAGGRIFQHGYTHQYETLHNPSGKSLVDWEFWDVNANAPIEGLSAQEARDRVARGKALLEGLALHPVGWVTPHYQADTSLYESFDQIYPLSFERRQYRVGSLTTSQFFPYAVRDVSNGVVLPENAGFVEDASSFVRIIDVALANRALTCPRLGLFFHPSLFTRSADGTQAVTEGQFEKFIADVRALGYRFVDPLALE